MSCEDEKKAYEEAIDDFLSDWDDFNDADNALENASNNFWMATGGSWGFGFWEGPVGILIGVGGMLAAEEAALDAAEVYNREYQDLLDGFDELQKASSAYCSCLHGEREEEE